VVDAFIMPVTPFPAATPMDYPHYGKSFHESWCRERMGWLTNL
jgi:hypothetical protein